MSKLLRCYAERHGGQWEAFCVDFDIAVQGSTFEEVYRVLNIAVTDYVERANELPAQDRRRLLHRRAPFRSRLWFLFAFLSTLLRSTGSKDDERHGYTLACPV
ncbi:MAG: hypothetical protein JO270_18485 [Acidobacteriaceae bacterium]|nr:hypothetical protein [Acidobacteriaceae bacterium]